jgi:hypothetical protein
MQSHIPVSNAIVFFIAGIPLFPFAALPTQTAHPKGSCMAKIDARGHFRPDASVQVRRIDEEVSRKSAIFPVEVQ